MKLHSTALLPVGFAEIWSQRTLVGELTRREVLGRYRGSIVGLAWSFFNPVLMLFVYTFVFSVVFQARWGLPGKESRIDFALILFVGMIVHGLFAEVANRSPNLITGNVNFVKKVIFPLELLPVVTLCAALFHFAVSLIVLMVAMLITGTPMQPTALLLPVVLAPLVFATLGVSWILASLGTFLRDVTHTVGIVTTVMLFLSPVFYPVSAVPAMYRVFIYLNPLTFPIEQARTVLVFGGSPDWTGLLIYTASAVALACLGYWWFQRTRVGFADVV